MEKQIKTPKDWYEATDEEINNMTVEEAKNIIIDHVERCLKIVGQEYGPTKWYAKAMELVLPIIKGE